MKKLVLYALIALGVSCSTVHTPSSGTLATVATAVAPHAGTQSKPVADDDDPAIPAELMRLLRGEADAPPPAAPDCAATPFCVSYIHIDGPIMGGSTKGALAAINAATPTQIIMLDINTPGGSMQEGFQLEKALEATKAKVFCVVDGSAYSMGFFILQSCQNRVMTKRSDLMAHEPLVILQANEGLTIRDLQEIVDDLTASARAAAEHAIRRMKMTYEQYAAKTVGKKWYMAYPEAMEVGAVDCVFAGNGNQALEELQATGGLTCASK